MKAAAHQMDHDLQGTVAQPEEGVLIKPSRDPKSIARILTIYDELVHTLKLSNSEAAEILGVSLATWRRYRNKQYPRHLKADIIGRVAALRKLAMAMIDRRLPPAWLRSYTFLGEIYISPIQLITRGGAHGMHMWADHVKNLRKAP